MSEVFVIGQITVRAPDKWTEYRNRVPATLEPWGAELVFRGHESTSFAGEPPHANIVVIRFPDLAAATGWHASPAYQALVPLREEAADVVLAAYQA